MKDLVKTLTAILVERRVDLRSLALKVGFNSFISDHTELRDALQGLLRQQTALRDLTLQLGNESLLAIDVGTSADTLQHMQRGVPRWNSQDLVPLQKLQTYYQNQHQEKQECK